MPSHSMNLTVMHPDDYRGGNTTYPSVRTDRYRVWTNTLNYPTTSRRDRPVNLYWDVQKRSEQEIAHIVTYYPNGTIYDHAHAGLGASSLDTEMETFRQEAEALLIPEADAIIHTKLRACVKVADAKVNLLVALKEASKTADLILGKASQLYQAYRQARRGDFVRAAHTLNIHPRRSHKTLLEMKYGWMPLLQDIKGAAELLAQEHLGRPLSFSVSAKTRDNKTLYVESGGNTGTTLVWKRQRSHVITRDVRVKIWCELENPHLSVLQQMGLTNPALYAWEIIPFSFVFDWIFSVGDWLTGLTAFNGVNVRKAMRSVSVDVVGFIAQQNSADYPTSGWVQSAHSVSRKHHYRRYDRAATDVVPSTLYPPVTNPFTSVERLFTALALLRAQSRRLDNPHSLRI